jgi:hypothetical protein
MRTYTAILSHYPTDPPTANVLDSTLVGTPALVRNDVGLFELVLNGAFPADATVVFVGFAALAIGDEYDAKAKSTGLNSIAIEVRDAAANLIDGFEKLSIHIMVKDPA